MTPVLDRHLLDRVNTWRADDPDPSTQRQLDDLVGRCRDGDESAEHELRDAFDGVLEFGTAGLRAALGPGPRRMNRSVVRRATAGVAAFISAAGGRHAVVGYDARHRSWDFARDTAAVFRGAGFDVVLMPQPLPTPVLAFTVRRLKADVGVMVTASHNPAADNGYKLYLHGGTPLVPPIDADIARRISEVPSVLEIPLDDSWRVGDASLLSTYLDAAATAVSPNASRELIGVATAMHGVGGAPFVTAMERAGFAAPIVVAEQFEPDGDFPSVQFPNPEEPGALDLALATAAEHSADIVIAHDPDADRCAVALPTPEGYQRLSGDDVGSLLAWWCIERGRRGWAPIPTGALATTLVSSSLLGAIADDAGLQHVITLTGFKWLAAVPDLTYAYEEALGYCVDPAHVRDKDGITAALRIIEMIATLRAEGRTAFDVRDDLANRFGLHLTEQVSLRVGSPSEANSTLDRLTMSPPTAIGPLSVTSTVNLAEGFRGLPPTPGLWMGCGDRGRIIVRPSGTEAKLKAYIELITPINGEFNGESMGDVRRAAKVEMAEVRRAVTSLVAC